MVSMFFDVYFKRLYPFVVVLFVVLLAGVCWTEELSFSE